MHSATSEPTAAASSQPARMRILIVEDHAPHAPGNEPPDPAGRADVITARDGEEALGYLLTQRFDVLLTDLRMPVMDGFELMRHAMKLPEHHRPRRIIAISGEYEASSRCGAPVAFLSKPFNLDALLEMLGGRMN